MRRLLTSLTCLATLLGLLNELCAAEMPRFDIHPLATWGNEWGQTSLADVDRDGDLDGIVGQHGEMRWYEFRKPWQGNQYYFLRNRLNDPSTAKDQ